VAGWIALAAGAALLVAAAVVLAVVGWRAYVRRALLRLLVRAEAVDALASALYDAFERLASGSDDELEIFVEEPESVERRAFHEIRARANMLADELDRMPLPKKLLPAAEALADAAYVICEQSSLVHEDDAGTAALDGLAEIDLGRVRAYTRRARHLVTGTCDVCGLDEMAVYGGGLYL
jgi:hypothetical protein